MAKHQNISKMSAVVRRRAYLKLQKIDAVLTRERCLLQNKGEIQNNKGPFHLGNTF